MNQEPDLYDYLRKECPDFKTAQAWYERWAGEWEQKLPWETEPGYSLRAMAMHVSAVLEGKTEEEVLKGWIKSHLHSFRYAERLYWGKGREEEGEIDLDPRVSKPGWKPGSESERCFSCKHNALCRSEVPNFMENYWCSAYQPNNPP